MQTLGFTHGTKLTLVPGFLTTAAVGAASDTTLTGIGGVAPYRIQLVSEDLPAEWVITIPGDGTAVIATSEAETAGEFTVVFRIKDAARSVRIVTRRLRVVALPLEVSGALADMAVGSAYSDSLPITGGVGDYTITLSALPAGIAAALAGGVDSPATISGTPTGAGLGPGTSFTFPVSITVEDSTPGTPQTDTFTQDVTITVAAMSLAGTYTNAGNVGAAYSSTVPASGGVGAPYVYAVASGTIPAGTTLNTATGEVSGTLTTAAVYNFTTSATDANGNSATSGAQTVTVSAVISRWNPADKSAEIDLSSSDAVATRNSTNNFAWRSVRSVTSHSTGKRFARISNAVAGSGNGFMYCGVGTSAAAINSFPGAGTTSWGLQCNNMSVPTFQHNGATTTFAGNAPTAPGESMFVAINFDAGHGWVGTENSLNTGITWCGNGDPATGNAPTFTFTPNITLFLMLGQYGTPQESRLYNQAGEGLYTVPSGYSMWE